MRIGSDFSIFQALDVQLTDPILNLSSADTSAAPPSGPTETDIPGESKWVDQKQSATNACGTTSLAMIMSYLGVPTTQADVDGAIRRTNIFTAPEDILSYARSKGLEAEGYNHGSLDQLKSYIDQGLPCQTLITADGSGSVNKMHYVDVVGYGTNADGSNYIKYHDPASGTTKEVSEADFEKLWGNTPLGFDHYFNVFGPDGTDLPSSNFDGIQGTNAAAEGIANFMNGGDRLINPNDGGDFIHGIFQVPAGIIGGIGGGIGGGVQLGADWVHDKLKDIPGLNIISGPFTDMFSGAGASFSDLCGGIGNATNDLGAAVGCLFDGDLKGAASHLWQGAKAVAGTVVNVASDVVNTVATAASDVGSAIVDTVSDIGDAIGSLF